MERTLTALDDERSRSPFAYFGNPLGLLREDQVPRFLGLITDPKKHGTRRFKVDDLTAAQNRVETAKVESMAASDATGGLPAVARFAGRYFIGDGHHRATADWLGGADEIEAHFLDLTEVSQALKSAKLPELVAKVDRSLGLVFGWGIVCTKNGDPYFDVQGDHITEAAMLKVTSRFMAGNRTMKGMHAGEQIGTVIHSMPLTAEVQKSFGITLNKAQTGWMVAVKPDDELYLDKFESGEWAGFSIGGEYIAEATEVVA